MTEENGKRQRIWKWIRIVLGILLACTLIGGVIWATYARPPLPQALAALESDSEVEVTLEPWLVFTPANLTDTGLIFYPGGRIDPRGYSDILREIAREGYLVVVPSMPINMAIFNPNAADGIIEAFPGIENWAIAGHSVGGVAAAIYTDTNPALIDGLAIWASFPADSSNLASKDLPVYMIYGELDAGVDRAAIETKKSLLPPDTVYVEIAGGDHHQFGSYLTKEGLDRSTISRAEQRDQIIAATLALLAQIAGD